MFHVDTAVNGESSLCEDLVGSTDRSVWVLDGTSGFSDRSFTDAASDGRWYVETLDGHIRDHIQPGRTLKTALREAITDAARELVDLVPQGADESLDTAVKRFELPACTVSLVRWDDDELRYLNLCDSSIRYRTTDAEAVRISAPGILSKVDAETQRRRHASDPDRSVMEYIRDTRAYANTPGGYWVAQLNPLAAEYAVTGRLDVDTVESVVLHTDGLDPLAEWMSGSTDILDVAAENGAEALIRRLRAAERKAEVWDDPGFNTGDDVCVAVLKPA